MSYDAFEVDNYRCLLPGHFARLGSRLQYCNAVELFLDHCLNFIIFHDENYVLQV